MNDAVVNGKLLPGGYTGSFKGGGPVDDSTLNLNQIRSWDEYLTLFSDGNYLNQTVNEVLWPDQNVVIYEFTNAWADHEKAAAATMAAMFDLDFNNTTVLTYGFSGGSDDRGNGTTPHSGNGNMRRSFFIPHEGARDHGRPRYMIVVGDDIQNFKIQGFINGGCYEGEEMDDAGVDVVRYESTLDEIFALTLYDYLKYDADFVINFDGFYSGDINFDVLYKSAVDYFHEYGPLSLNGVDRYLFGRLDDFFLDVLVMDRVFYLSAELNIPSGRSVLLDVKMIKQGSFDFYGSGSEDLGIYGFDMFTETGSILAFDYITAGITGADYIEIVRQNFGFDPGNGVLSVTLDQDVLHYFIEVKMVTDD
jgi:hypothetical protein